MVNAEYLDTVCHKVSTNKGNLNIGKNRDVSTKVP
jgi:hypothetical protein